MKSLRLNPTGIQRYTDIADTHNTHKHAGLGHVRCRVDTILKRRNLHLQIPGLFGNLFTTTCCNGYVGCVTVLRTEPCELRMVGSTTVLAATMPLQCLQ